MVSKLRGVESRGGDEWEELTPIVRGLEKVE